MSLGEVLANRSASGAAVSSGPTCAAWENATCQPKKRPSEPSADVLIDRVPPSGGLHRFTPPEGTQTDTIITMRLVTALADRDKVAMLTAAGLVEQWWVKPLDPAGASDIASGCVAGHGFSGLLGPAPPVYDPGGPVLLINRLDHNSDVASVEDAPVAMGMCSPSSPPPSETTAIATWPDGTGPFPPSGISATPARVSAPISDRVLTRPVQALIVTSREVCRSVGSVIPATSPRQRPKRRQ